MRKINQKIDTEFQNQIPPQTAEEYKQLEENILNFSGDIYNNEITVTFIQHVRGDIKFDTLDQLIDQLKKDRETVDRILTE